MDNCSSMNYDIYLSEVPLQCLYLLLEDIAKYFWEKEKEEEEEGNKMIIMSCFLQKNFGRIPPTWAVALQMVLMWVIKHRSANKFLKKIIKPDLSRPNPGAVELSKNSPLSDGVMLKPRPEWGLNTTKRERPPWEIMAVLGAPWSQSISPPYGEAHVCLAGVKSNRVLRRVASRGRSGTGRSEASLQLVRELVFMEWQQSSGFGATDLSPPGSVDTNSHHETSPQHLVTWHPTIPLICRPHFWSLYKKTHFLCTFVSPISPRSASWQVAQLLQAPLAQRHKRKDPHNTQIL